MIGFTKNELRIKGMITRTADSNRQAFSTKFLAILHRIKKLPLKESKICGLKEIELESSVREYFVDQSLSFTLSSGVYANFSTYENTVSASMGKSYTEETCYIDIYSRMKSLQQLKDMVQEWEAEYLKSFAHQTITLTGRTRKDKGGWSDIFEFSDRFFAVLHKISKIDFGDAPTDMLELHLTEPGRQHMYRDNGEVKETMRRKMSRMVPRHFKFEDEVNGEVSWKEDKENKDDYTTITNYSIKISSTTKSSKQLAELVTTWEKEYQDFKFSGNGLCYYVYDPPKLPEGNGSPPPPNVEEFSEYSFESSKTFNNVFFSKKEKIVERIKFFMDNESWYQARGIPYTLTFLFHGEPGCGKTSSIKAIANLTQRHIVSVPLKNVKTVEELYNIFYGSTINKKPMPVDKKLFVLEDIDCASLKDIVKKREEEKEEDSSSDSEDTSKETDDKEKKSDDKEKKKRKKKKKKAKDGKSKLTLADLLEVFDGVMEMKGRMMVITTNYPEKLDSALIRPGRVDVNLKFGKCHRDDILGIYKNFYNQDTPMNFNTDRLPNDKWTPAEVVQIFLNDIVSPASALEIICQDHPDGDHRTRIAG